jgi:hypothetical protein
VAADAQPAAAKAQVAAQQPAAILPPVTVLLPAVAPVAVLPSAVAPVAVLPPPVAPAAASAVPANPVLDRLAKLDSCAEALRQLLKELPA